MATPGGGLRRSTWTATGSCTRAGFLPRGSSPRRTPSPLSRTDRDTIAQWMDQVDLDGCQSLPMRKPSGRLRKMSGETVTLRP